MTKIEDYAFEIKTTIEFENGLKEVFGDDFKHFHIDWKKTEYAESVFNDQGILEFDGTNERSRVLTFKLKIYLKPTNEVEVEESSEKKEEEEKKKLLAATQAVLDTFDKNDPFLPFLDDFKIIKIIDIEKNDHQG